MYKVLILLVVQNLYKVSVALSVWDFKTFFKKFAFSIIDSMSDAVK